MDKSLPVGRIGCKTRQSLRNFTQWRNEWHWTMQDWRATEWFEGFTTHISKSGGAKVRCWSTSFPFQKPVPKTKGNRKWNQTSPRLWDAKSKPPTQWDLKKAPTRVHLGMCDLLASSLCFYLSGEESFPNSSLLFSESSTEGFQSYLGSLLLHKSKHVVTWCYL